VTLFLIASYLLFVFCQLDKRFIVAHCAVPIASWHLVSSDSGLFIIVLIDTIATTQVRPRQPEKVNRPDAKSPAKPDWIRVRAPNTRG
jgi:hypothetical protein